jgi:hypothetical protein
MYKLSERGPGLGRLVRGPEAMAVQRERNPVLGSLSEIVSDPRHVTMDYDRLREFAHEHAHDRFVTPRWDEPIFLDVERKPQQAVDAAELLFVGNAINFQFTYLGEGREEKKYSFTSGGIQWRGAFGMWAALKNAFESGVPVTDPEFLAGMTLEDAAGVFRLGESHMPMVEERVRIFNEVGKVLIDKYDSSIWNVLEGTRDDRDRFRMFNGGKGLVERLVSDFPSFRDSAVYKGREVVFNKRAQLNAMMMHEKFLGMGIELFPEDDFDALTVAANYELPKMARKLGLLRYSDELARKVDGGIPIPYGGEEEMELRGSTIYACRHARNLINGERPAEFRIQDPHIDYLLFSLGRQCRDVRHHYTATTAY